MKRVIKLNGERGEMAGWIMLILSSEHNMKITMIGTGYVGLVTGTCFASTGNKVTCVDIDEGKIERLKQGIIPIYEPGLTDMVLAATGRGNLLFTTKLEEALADCDICFIAVGTPMGEDGSADLHYVLEAASQIGQYMQADLLVVDKSTVPVGTGDQVRERIARSLEQRGVNYAFDVISNPEFLKEGNACQDFMQPDRVIIGTDNPQSIEMMERLYDPFIRSREFFITMDIRSAELTKYAANAMLATKISFINEIANISERVGADINKVRSGIASDSRIGYAFLNPGCGYGGSCFPKDVKALIHSAQEVDYTPALLEAVEQVNYNQKRVLPTKVEEVFAGDLDGKIIAIWGLAFKPGTDDMREAPSIELIKSLAKYNVQMRAYDPEAISNARQYYLQDVANVEYFNNKYDALNNADALIIVTEWKEFLSPDFYEIASRMNGKLIIDGRNIYKRDAVSEYGLEYKQIGVK